LKVLVTDGAYKHTLAIVRSLGRHNIEVGVLASSSDALSFHSRYCSRAIFCPPPDKEDVFIEFLLHLLPRQQADLLIPVGYRSVEAISKHKDELKKYTSIELPEHQKVRIALDKKSTYQLSESTGVPYPKTIYPQGQGEIERLASDLSYPVVIKHQRETAGEKRVYYALDQEQLIEKYREICLAASPSEASPMIQEYIRGRGYGFFALYQQGLCKRIFMHRRVRETPPTGGASTCSESYYHEQLKEYGQRLLDALNWHGVAMVEFKLDERDGQFKLMEINPKFWGSLDLALAAGVDFPYYLCEMSAGKEIAYSEDYKSGLRYHWPIHGELQHILKKKSSLFPFLRDLLNPKVKSNLVLYDMKPTLWGVKALFKSLLRRLRRRAS
jgi:predicted ATP-grasp superfamily ATP-dependent carboligase